MADKQGPDHVVVDGSNIATEGRSMPSLAQLEEAVGSFMEEYPDTQVTVVVDATFAHRIDKSEVKRYEDGIANNELVAPPAGAVGRGDAFVLGIADKANSVVLSNDSFQEFHGDYAWLFDDGRLIGGKPVPHVGWVWVERNPVRGPVSRKATRDSKSTSSRSKSAGGSRSRSGGGRRQQTASKAASEPMPVPTAPPPGAKRTADAEAPEPAAGRPAKSAPKGGEPVNELMPFLEFVEQHPAGSTVTGVPESYSSHGAYVTIGDVRGYVPLRMMADPAPRSAKKILKLGDEVELVVVSFAPARRSIDCALPVVAEAMLAEARAASDSDGDDDGAGDDAASASSGDEPSEQPSKRRSKRAGRTRAATTEQTADAKTPAKKTAAMKAAAKKAAAKKTTAKKTTAKKAAAKKTTAKKTTAKKTTAKKAAAKKTA
ncbi:MAG: S1 RNA-binding domain-containing protein, partial [Actinomycetota bacterium]